MAEIPSLRLSRSMLSVASSSEKSIDVGSCGSIHWSSDSPHVGERLPLDVRAKGDPPLVLSTTTTTPRDPSVVSPSLRPMSGVVTWAAGGADHAASSGTTVAASSYAWLVTVAAASICVEGASTGDVTPTAVGATSVSGRSVCSDVGSGITSVVGCLATSVGVPSASVIVCPPEGTSTTIGGA